MPQVLKWQSPSAQPAAMIDTCVRAINSGQVIGYPTESAYFLVADPKSKSAVSRLKKLLGEGADYPVLDAFPPTDMPETLLTGASPLARRFARRVWPGPIAIETSIKKNEPPVARYIPNSHCSRDFMQAIDRPLAFGGITDEEGHAIIDAESLAELVGNEVTVIMDVGETHFGDLPTVLRVNGNRFSIPLEGVVPRPDLMRQGDWIVIFICTGNTCRSPLAEAIMKRMLADKLNCEPDDLVQRGFRITSMGLSAHPGNLATGEAMIVAREMKADLTAHTSRPLAGQFLEFADYVLAMTAIHRDSLIALHPRCEPVTRLLCGTTDLADPIGNDLAVYRTCAKTIEKHLTKLVTDILAIGAPVYEPSPDEEGP